MASWTPHYIPSASAQMIVKSNHHLSELCRMTFKKSDPTVVTLYFRSGHDATEPHPRVYHMDNKDQLILILRENIRQFR